MKSALLPLSLLLAAANAQAANNVSEKLALCDNLQLGQPFAHLTRQSFQQSSVSSAAPMQGAPALQAAEIPVLGDIPVMQANAAAARYGSLAFETSPAKSAPVLGTETNTEKYAHYERNPVFRSAEQPISTFSIDVDTGSYANVRRLLQQQNTLPPASAVRIEEFINYFDYGYALPSDGKPFALHSEVIDSPWQPNAKLLRIALKAADADPAQLPPANLVFLIDTSGSMDAENKLPLVQKTACYFAAHLREQDHLSLITYAGHTEILLPPTAGNQFDKIYQSLKKLSAEGSTAGEAAIRLAYDAAEKNFKTNGINRILIATDGDFNVGLHDTEALKTLVADKRKSGISLSTLGFGGDNYNDEMMEQIADIGNGNYSYIDSLDEAKKVLIRQLSSTLATLAHDVKIQIEFNPQAVKEYRLVGYENRLLKAEDFNNDKVDAGDIGAGHSVTAFYEFIPQGEQGWLNDSRYQAPEKASDEKVAQEYAFIQLRYKTAHDQASQLISQPIAIGSKPLEQADTNSKFAIAVASFAQALQGGEFNGAMDWAAISRLAESNLGQDPYQERAELLRLIRQAQQLSAAK